jgi:hypothetical protein
MLGLGGNARHLEADDQDDREDQGDEDRAAMANLRVLDAEIGRRKIAGCAVEGHATETWGALIRDADSREASGPCDRPGV